MSLPPITLRITARDDASSVLNRVGQSASEMGRQVADSASGVREVDNAISEIGNNRGLSQAADNAQGLGSALNGAADQTDKLKDRLEGIRNTGVVLGGIGAAGLTLAQTFIAASVEGQGLERRLESLLKQQGRLQDLGNINDAISDVAVRGSFDDDDEIRDAAIHLASFGAETQAIGDLLPRVARQVRTGFGTMESVADGMGKAIANFDLGPLSKSGLLFSDQEKAAAQAAKEIGGVAGQMKIVEILTSAVDRNTVGLEDSLSEAEKAANNMKREMDDAMTNVGAGAADAQKWVHGLAGSILGVSNNAPELQKSAGFIGYVGSAALASVGGVVSLGAQVGLLRLAFPGLGTSAKLAFGAVKAAAASTIPFLLGVAKALAVPFAILAAGAAVGIAGYEALRATGVLKNHKSTAEIIADTRKTLMGDPEAEAEKAVSKATGGAGASTTGLPTSVTESVAGVYEEGDTSELADTTPLPNASSPGTGKGKKAATSKGTSAETLAEKARKEQKKLADDRAREHDKFQKQQSQLADRIARDQEDLALAQLDETFATRIAELEAFKTDTNEAQVEYQIAQLKAQQMQEEADIKAKYDDRFAEGSGRKIAGLKAAGLLKRAGIEFNKRSREMGVGGIASELARKGVAASADLLGAGGRMFSMASGNYSGEGSFVNGNAQWMREGIARAVGAESTYGPVRGSNGVAKNHHKIPVQSRFAGYDSAGDQIFEVFGKIVVPQNDGGMHAAGVLS